MWFYIYIYERESNDVVLGNELDKLSLNVVWKVGIHLFSSYE